MTAKKITMDEIKEVIANPDAVTSPSDPNAPDFNEIQDKLKTGEMKITMAPQLHVEDLSDYIDRVLDAICFDSAWVSDESMISDFPLDDEDLIAAGDQLGIPISQEEYIYQVAQRLKDSEE